MEKFENTKGEETMVNSTTDLSELTTLKKLSVKYGIPYGTAYKEIIMKKRIPFIKFGGIRVNETAFIRLFKESGVI